MENWISLQILQTFTDFLNSVPGSGGGRVLILMHGDLPAQLLRACAFLDLIPFLCCFPHSYFIFSPAQYLFLRFLISIQFLCKFQS